MKKNILRCGETVAFLIMIAWSAPAMALSAEQVLEKVDASEYGAKDTVAITKMELQDKDGTISNRKLKIYQKGTDKRLIKFLEPADVKGMAFLDAGDDKMYLYMPAMHKIRRIAGHVKNDNFAGTDFSFEDLSSERFSERMQVLSMTEDPKHYVLEVKAKPGKETQYGKLVVHVRKKDFMFDEMEFFDKTGEKWKVLKRSEFKKVGKYMQSFRSEIEDLKKKHKTRTIVESIECDTGLKDRFFSKRQLKR